MSDLKSAPIPPSNSSKELEKYLYDRLLKTCEHFPVGKFVGCGVCFDELRAYRDALLQSERQRWASELVEKLPEVPPRPQGFGYQADLQYNEGHEKGLNNYRDAVLTIIKETTGILHTSGTPTAPSSEAGNPSEEAR